MKKFLITEEELKFIMKSFYKTSCEIGHMPLRVLESLPQHEEKEEVINEGKLSKMDIKKTKK